MSLPDGLVADAPQPRPLDVRELATLLVRMEQAVAGTARGFATGMGLIAGMFAALGLVFGLVKHAWGIAAYVGGFAVLMLVIGRAAARKTSPAQMQPVLDAVRDAPGRVTTIRHYTSSDSRALFVMHWLEVRTDDARLVMRAQDDWRQLLDYLTRRCPGASVSGR